MLSVLTFWATLYSEQHRVVASEDGQIQHWHTHLGQDLGECGGLVHDVAVWMEHMAPDYSVAGDDGRRFGR